MTHLRYRDTDRRFKSATDAQLAAWEADQPGYDPKASYELKPIIRKRSWAVTVKEIAGAILAVFVAGVIIALLGGQLQGFW